VSLINQETEYAEADNCLTDSLCRHLHHNALIGLIFSHFSSDKPTLKIHLTVTLSSCFLAIWRSAFLFRTPRLTVHISVRNLSDAVTT